MLTVGGRRVEGREGAGETTTALFPDPWFAPELVLARAIWFELGHDGFLQLGDEVGHALSHGRRSRGSHRDIV